MNKLRGRMGEELAAAYLRRKGYEILAAGYHSRYGEIDIVAAKKGIVAFVEVKLRDNGSFAAAMEAVDRHKQEKLRRTALMWIAQNGDALQPRFDVCEVYMPARTDPAKAKISYKENAFE
ncbi:MAG: YraN family protein [Clostridia bacterium]|nr:YraN family protein [Clostridia bacterium]